MAPRLLRAGPDWVLRVVVLYVQVAVVVTLAGIVTQGDERVVAAAAVLGGPILLFRQIDGLVRARLDELDEVPSQ